MRWRDFFLNFDARFYSNDMADMIVAKLEVLITEYMSVVFMALYRLHKNILFLTETFTKRNYNPRLRIFGFK